MATVTGTTGDDVLGGTSGDDSIFGDTGNDILFGFGGNNTIDGGPGADIVNAGTGNDTYYVDNANDLITDAGGNDLVISVTNYVLSAGIERLFLDPNNLVGPISGTGNGSANYITGNDFDNSIGGLEGNDTLVGNAGNDTLNGGAGADTLIGGAGLDTYVVDSTSDKIIELVGEGTDQVLSSATYTLAANVENLTLTGILSVSGTGNADANILQGNLGKNTLKGLGGDDIIDGSSGGDVMYGGAGNDTYYVDNKSDRVIELALEGTDTVNSSISYTLTAEVDNLILTGSANIAGTGNILDNTLTGNGGDNTLDGGIGVDTMMGAGGNDTYVVDNAGDIVADTGGNDTIKSGAFDIDVANANYAGIENITLTGAAAINATGDANANILDGSANTASNILTGGAGNDTYLLDVHDVVVDSGGNDTMKVGFSFDLSTDTATVGSTTTHVNVSGVENITLLGKALNATGDANDNILIGDALANTLDGGGGNDTLDGGLGADHMIGGAGDDTYIVDNIKDVVIETTTLGVDPGGTDMVQGSITYTLAGDAHIEDLTLLGTANINATGNALDNTLTGNTGNNILDGGLGADSMVGGFGADTYIIDNANDVIVENLGEGIDLALSSVSVAALASNVENLTLTGTSAIDATGNGLANIIIGNSAVNSLDGAGGNDTYFIDTSDIVNDTGGDLSDTIAIAFSFDLSTNDATVGTVVIPMTISNIENITLTGKANLNATGDGNDNILTGNLGINTLDGRAGNDTYVVGAHDVILVDTAGTHDTVMSALSYSIAARLDLEDITLIGTGSVSATGNDNDNILIGNSGNNLLSGGAGSDHLIGGAGNDLLDGGQGGEADVMVGGTGNDTYVVDTLADTITENANEGVDTIQTNMDFTLDDPLFINIENLTLTGSAVNGTGNDSNNVITGDALANVLNGGIGDDTLIGGAGSDILFGGPGGDLMIGGSGNDVYYVDSSSDVVIDTSGTDIVISSVSFALPTGVEFLTLTGASDLTGTGNELNNTITANLGSDLLSGLGGDDLLVGGPGNDILNGGAGIDTMIGGAGNDTYFIDNKFDHFVENPNEGTNDMIATVFSVVTLPDNIESVWLLDQAPAGTTTVVALIANGDAHDNLLIGNSLANTLSGNDGNDILDGGPGGDLLSGGAGNDILYGGLGADTISGGTGADIFLFLKDTSFDAVDVLRDFNIGQGDRIDISDLLDPTIYHAGTTNPTDFIRITTSGGTSQLYVDLDGPGTAHTFVQIATLPSLAGFTNVQQLIDNGTIIDHA